MKNHVQSIQNCFISWEWKWNVGIIFWCAQNPFGGFGEVDCGALFTARFKTTQDPRLHNLQKFITLINLPSAVYMGCMWSPKWIYQEYMDLCRVKDCRLPAAIWPPKGYIGLCSILYAPSWTSAPQDEHENLVFWQCSFRPRGGRRFSGSSSPSVRLGAQLFTMFSTAATVTVAHVLCYCSAVMCITIS